MKILFAERFKSARTLNGLSLQDLADKLHNKITRQSLHKYEKGDVIPDKEMVALLSEALNVTPDFFYRETKVEFSKIEFRKLQNLSSKEESRIIESVKDELARYLELEEILSIQVMFSNPLSEMPDIKSFDDIEAAAEKVRDSWNLGTDPIFNSIALLEDNHIKVIEVHAGDSFDGMQTWVNGNIPVIAINSDKVKSLDRKRFTVLHELGHLLLPMNLLGEPEKERFCHQFAGAMLFPSNTAFKELGKGRSRLMIQELGALKKQYGISIQAIVMRAKDLGIISDNYCRQFFFYLKQMDWKIHEPIEYTGVEQSNRFDQLLFRALAEELLSTNKAASLKNMSLLEFQEVFLMKIK